MRSLLLAFLLSVSVAVMAWAEQPRELSETDTKSLLERAELLQQAFAKGDAEFIIRYTHPVILQFFPSPEKFAETTREAIKSLADQATFEEVKWGTPTPVYISGDQEITFLPRTSVMRVGDRRARSVSFMIAGRKRDTTEWYFLDSATLRKKPEFLWQLFPDLPRDIKTPTNTIEVLP